MVTRTVEEEEEEVQCATRHQNVVTLSALSAEPQDVSALTINKIGS